MKRLLALIGGIALTLLAANAQTGRELNFQKWAITPPMGWNSWDCYGPTVVESEVKANADYMAQKLSRFGWEYVVVDIRWFVENDKAGGYNQTNPIYVVDEWGRYTPAVNRFPSAADGAGFKPLADYVHSKGLKFGIHLMRGLPKVAAERKLPVKGAGGITCDMICNNDSACTWLRDNYKVDSRKPGAQEYYNSCFDMYADWGVDFVKIDDLSRPYHTGEIEMIRKAIDQCGRPIVLSVSPGETPLERVGHVSTHANMWRTVDDFWDNWTQLNYQFQVCAKWAPYIAPGTWPDADMLPLGKISIRGERGSERMTGFTRDEQYTMMNLWSIFKSPLMFGGDLPQNDAATDSLLTNENVLFMHSYSTNNRQLSNTDGRIIWAADDPTNGDKFVALFNTGGSGFLNPDMTLYRSGTISYLTTGHCTDVDVEIPAGSRQLVLLVSDGGDSFDSDHADWINPTLTLTDGSKVDLTTIAPLRRTQGWGDLHINTNIEGGKLSVNGVKYEKGFATHANSVLVFDLPEGVVKFSALAGIDNTGSDQGSKSSMEFFVAVDDPTFRQETTDSWAGGNVTINIDPALQSACSGYVCRQSANRITPLEADIECAEKLYLVVTDGGDGLSYDHADWLNPVLVDADGTETSLMTLQWDPNPVNGYNAARRNLTNDGRPLTVEGQKYDFGIGCNSPSMIVFTLPDGHNYKKFKTLVSYDDEAVNFPSGVTMEFRVFTVDPTPNAKVAVPLNLEDLGFDPSRQVKVTEMWHGDNLGLFSGSEFAPELRSHASGLYRISATGRQPGAKVSMLIDAKNFTEANPFEIKINVTGASAEDAYAVVKCDGKIIGSMPLAADATASFLCTNVEAGNHTFQALYSGNASYAPASATPSSITVEPSSVSNLQADSDKITFATAPGFLKVTSDSDCELKLFLADGSLFRRVALKAGTTEIQLPAGLYIACNSKILVP